MATQRGRCDSDTPLTQHAGFESIPVTTQSKVGFAGVKVKKRDGMNNRDNNIAEKIKREKAH